MVFFPWPVLRAVFLVLVATTVRANRPPRFVRESPSVVIASKTGPLSLNCSADGLPKPNIEWYKDGARLALDSRRIQLDSGALLFKQVIHKRGNRPDAGIYYCLARNSQGVIISGDTVLKFPVLSKQFLEQPQNTTVRKGGNVRFGCRIEKAVPTSEVKWEKDGTILTERNPKLTMLPEGVLQISNVQMSDQGNYKCIVSNGFRVRHSQFGTLTVLEGVPTKPKGPQVLAPMWNVTVTEGQDALLECFAVGFPLPTLSWKRLRKNFEIAQGLPVGSSRAGAFNWKVNTVTRRDEGMYQCSATSGGHTVTSSVWLFVRAPPNIKITPENQSIAYGLPVKVSCRADGHPIPKVTWFKDGRVVQQSERLAIRSGQGSANLTISGVTQEDSGAYQCFAENAMAKIQKTAVLQVQMADDQPGPPENVVAEVLSASAVQVKWSPPLVGSRDLVAYMVFCKDLDHEEIEEQQYVAAPGARSYTYRGLSGFTNYTFHVIAVHSNIMGLPSKKVTVTTKTDIPSEAPSNLSVKSTEPNVLHISWVPPPTLHLNGLLIEHIVWYKEVHSANPVTVPVPEKEQSVILRGLLPGAAYVVKVAAVTSDGQGPFCANVQATVLGADVPTTSSPRCILPLPPEALACSSRGQQSLHITWQKPLPPSGVVDYEVSYKVKGSTSDVSRQVVSGQTVTLTNLHPGKVYSISVRSQYGPASLCDVPWGAAQQECKTDQPDSIPAPQNVLITFITSTSVQLEWDRPAHDITKYEVFYSPYRDLPLVSWTKQEEEIFVINPRYETGLAGLLPNTTYFMCVQAVSFSQGVGKLSRVYTIPMQLSDTARSSLPDVSLEPISADSVEVSWSMQAGMRGRIKGFTLCYSHDAKLPHTQWSKKPIATNFILEEELRFSERLHLKVGETYSIWVRTEFPYNISGPWAKKTYPVGLPVASVKPSADSSDEEHVGGDPDGDFAVKLGIIIGCIISAFFTVILVLFIIWRNPCRQQRQSQAHRGKSDQSAAALFPLKVNSSSHSGQSSTFEESSLSSSVCQCRCTCGAGRHMLGSYLPLDKRTMPLLTSLPQSQPVQASKFKRGMQVQSKDASVTSSSSVSAEVSSDGQTRPVLVSRLHQQSVSVEV